MIRDACWDSIHGDDGLGRWVGVWLIAAASAGLLLMTGCAPERPLAFEPNLVHALKYEIKEGIPMTQSAEDAYWVVSEMFGTPDVPRVPDMIAEDEELGSLLSMERLLRASGPVGEPGRGLYRQHCVSCHGVTGDGRGLTAAMVTPYPRDYRKGVFKFKSTERGSKPTREDLAKLIRHGIPGSAMVAIPELNKNDEDVEALVDYVIYLSMRGELERSLVDDAFFELDLEGGDRLIVPADRESLDPELKETFDESWEIAADYAVEIGAAWLDADDSVVEVPEPPAELIVTNSREDYVAATMGKDADKLAASVARGRELFTGKIASCSKCHGEKGAGDGQTTDYDDWTKDWTVAAGLKPEDREALIPLLARGALAPVNARPRNLSQGIFHGGSSAEDLYRRITQGIEGSPMPAATFVDGQFEAQDVWHLINFIRSLQTEDAATDTPPISTATQTT